jgi:hypothetical protein
MEAVAWTAIAQSTRIDELWNRTAENTARTAQNTASIRELSSRVTEHLD